MRIGHKVAVIVGIGVVAGAVAIGVQGFGGVEREGIHIVAAAVVVAVGIQRVGARGGLQDVGHAVAIAVGIGIVRPHVQIVRHAVVVGIIRHGIAHDREVERVFVLVIAGDVQRGGAGAGGAGRELHGERGIGSRSDAGRDAGGDKVRRVRAAEGNVGDRQHRPARIAEGKAQGGALRHRHIAEVHGGGLIIGQLRSRRVRAGMDGDLGRVAQPKHRAAVSAGTDRRAVERAVRALHQPGLGASAGRGTG